MEFAAKPRDARKADDIGDEGRVAQGIAQRRQERMPQSQGDVVALKEGEAELDAVALSAAM